jgi:hypothetical protein
VPPQLNFGVCQLGISVPYEITALVNPISNGTASIASILIKGSNEFSIVGTTCGAQLAGGSACTITVKFSPSTKTLQTGEVVITDNASNSPQIVYLEGSGD